MSADAELKIRIATESDAAGLNEAKEALHGVKEAAHGASETSSELGEAGHKLVEEFSSLRSARHALRAIIEIARGGTGAIAGTTMAVRILGEAFEGLIPVIGPILIAVTTLITVTASLMAKNEEKAEKAEEAGKKEEEATKRAEEAVKRQTEAIGAAIEAIKKEVEQQDRLNASLVAQANHHQQEIADSLALMEADKNLTVAKLNHQRELDLAKAKPEEREGINRRYDNLIEQTKAKSDDDVFALKIKGVQDEIVSKGNQKADLEEQVEGLNVGGEARKEKMKQTAEAAESAGVEPDASGSYAAEAKKLRKEFTERSEHPRANETPLEQEYTGILGKKAALANQAETARLDYEKWNKEIGTKVESTSKKIEDLGAELEHLTRSLEPLNKQRETARETVETQKAKEGRSEADKAAKDAYEIERAKKEAQKAEFDSQAGNPKLGEEAKLAAKQNALRKQTELDQMQLDHAGLLGTSEAAKITLRQKIKDDGRAVAYAGEKDEGKELAKTVHEHQGVVKGLVAQTGDKSLIEALKASTATLKNNPLGELQGLLRELVGALAVSRGGAAAGAMQSEIDALRAEIKKLAKGNNN